MAKKMTNREVTAWAVKAAREKLAGLTVAGVPPEGERDEHVAALVQEMLGHFEHIHPAQRDLAVREVQTAVFSIWKQLLEEERRRKAREGNLMKLPLLEARLEEIANFAGERGGVARVDYNSVTVEFGRDREVSITVTFSIWDAEKVTVDDGVFRVIERPAIKLASYSLSGASVAEMVYRQTLQQQAVIVAAAIEALFSKPVIYWV